MLAFELVRGRRLGFETEGMGAWLVIGAEFSNMSSWKMCSGSFEAGKRVFLAILARSGWAGEVGLVAWRWVRMVNGLGCHWMEQVIC